MKFEVRLTADAERDLEEIYGYISENDSTGSAEATTGRIERAIATLADTPARGARLPEAMEMGIRDHREIFFKPYRIIYTARGQTVIVKVISDGRRDMRALFQRRLLGA